MSDGLEAEPGAEPPPDPEVLAEIMEDVRTLVVRSQVATFDHPRTYRAGAMLGFALHDLLHAVDMERRAKKARARAEARP